MRYEVKAYQICMTYEQCWIEVFADSEEEALELVKQSPDSYEYLDGEPIQIISNEWEDQYKWTAIQRN